MQHCKRVIHLCTGDRTADGAIAAWLERHGLDVAACADAYDACTVALTQPEPTPDLAFIGADWLAPDELAIIHYFRQTWPGLPLVVYGSTPATTGFQDSTLMLVCRSAGALRNMLAEPPDALLERFLNAPRSRSAHDCDWQSRAQGSRSSGQRVGSDERRGARLAPEGLGPDCLAVELNSPSDVLTPEELAALLDDAEK